MQVILIPSTETDTDFKEAAQGHSAVKMGEWVQPRQSGWRGCSYLVHLVHRTEASYCFSRGTH